MVVGGPCRLFQSLLLWNSVLKFDGVAYGAITGGVSILVVMEFGLKVIEFGMLLIASFGFQSLLLWNSVLKGKVLQN